MQLDDITPLILTYNEAPNIGRILNRLGWARQILVIDSGSTDETKNILSAYAQVRVIHRPFDSFAGQCNFGLSQIETSWVLSLDADYVLPQGFADELDGLTVDDAVNGYRARFRYCIFGRPLRGTLYPPRTVLYRRDKAEYQDIGHGHRVRIKGQVTELRAIIDHDDRKSLSRWLDSQRAYAQLEAEHLLATPKSELSRADRLRLHIWPAAPAALFYTLLVKRCLFDGWPGWYYALQRTYAEVLLSLELLDRRLREGQSQIE